MVGQAVSPAKCRSERLFIIPIGVPAVRTFRKGCLFLCTGKPVRYATACGVLFGYPDSRIILNLAGVTEAAPGCLTSLCEPNRMPCYVHRPALPLRSLFLFVGPAAYLAGDTLRCLSGRLRGPTSACDSR